ncbi:homoserine dehydrogenase [Neobacillus sp. SM06]|uniref:homoserine dehydrogenase n=1 Tax=Neobacillus sp. SM06 TaxID=3422492 RepID=UPI003D29C636
MSVIRVAILGFGTVGEGVYKTIQSHEQELTAILGKKVEVAAVLIRNQNKVRTIGEKVLVTTDFEEILRLPQLDVVMEAIVEQEPSFTYLKKAIARGCHIITANKEMFAHHGRELLEIAAQHNVSVGFEATVAGGIPIIQTLRQLFHVNQVQKIQGILNGTSNFILTEMREKKQSFASALKQAQENGFAEADPTNDIEGIDAFYKLMILSKMAFGQEPKWNEVELQGIAKITSEWIAFAEKLGLRFKHIATVSKNGNQVTGSVKPVLVAKDHPFYSIEGVQNAVNIVSDIVGSITLQGPGAGMFPTASAMLEDLIFVLKNKAETVLMSKRVEDAANSIQQSKGVWIVDGVYKKRTIHSIHWISELKNGCYLLKAAAEEIAELAEQNKGLISFPIYGDVERLNQKESKLAITL